MKNLLIIIAITTSIVLLGCRDQNEIEPNKDLTSQITDFPIESLNEDELASLLFMREEEKLAKDVYLTLYDKWNVNIFLNISYSEQTHMDAVLTLLNKYDLKDPVGDNAVGVFENVILQNLYSELVAQGSTNILEAYKVGATIEDLDIYDLSNALKNIDNQDVTFVFENLTKGSRNHLRSFYGQVISSGGTYDAQFISEDELNAIVDSPKEKGA
jgi:hypothetical protein